MKQGYRSRRCVIISICTIREQAVVCFSCAGYFSASLPLREMLQSALRSTCFFPFQFSCENSLLRQKCKKFLNPLSCLTLMLKVSVFHSTCVPRPAIIQPSHTVCNGDSGTSSLPSSSTLSCREPNQSSLSYFSSFSDHYTSQKQHIRMYVRTNTHTGPGWPLWRNRDQD